MASRLTGVAERFSGLGIGAGVGSIGVDALLTGSAAPAAFAWWPWVLVAVGALSVLGFVVELRGMMRGIWDDDEPGPQALNSRGQPQVVVPVEEPQTRSQRRVQQRGPSRPLPVPSAPKRPKPVRNLVIWAGIAVLLFLLGTAHVPEWHPKFLALSSVRWVQLGSGALLVLCFAAVALDHSASRRTGRPHPRPSGGGRSRPSGGGRSRRR